MAPLLLAEFASPRLVAMARADLLLDPIIALARDECAAQRCAMPTVLDHAGHILFVGVLRHLVAQASVASGLPSGLSEPRIASALVAMHGAPEKTWKLETLAEQAGMSRTVFALRFKSTLQRTPGKYLSSLRMHIAQRRVQSGEGLKAAARASGYTNVSALSRALGQTANAA